MQPIYIYYTNTTHHGTTDDDCVLHHQSIALPDRLGDREDSPTDFVRRTACFAKRNWAAICGVNSARNQHNVIAKSCLPAMSSAGWLKLIPPLLFRSCAHGIVPYTSSSAVRYLIGAFFLFLHQLTSLTQIRFILFNTVGWWGNSGNPTS